MVGEDDTDKYTKDPIIVWDHIKPNFRLLLHVPIGDISRRIFFRLV